MSESLLGMVVVGIGLPPGVVQNWGDQVIIIIHSQIHPFR